MVMVMGNKDAVVFEGEFEFGLWILAGMVMVMVVTVVGSKDVGIYIM